MTIVTHQQGKFRCPRRQNAKIETPRKSYIQDNKPRLTAEEAIGQPRLVVCLSQSVVVYDDYNPDHDSTIHNRKRANILYYNYLTTTNESVNIFFEEMTK
jgi:hypothetical protein